MLLELCNPKYRELQNIYVHLKDLQINNHGPKSELPVHVILGISDYPEIKIEERPRVGFLGEPIAELTNFGRVIVSPGQETGVKNMLFSKISLHDCEKLCSLDCLCIEERRVGSNYVYEEFQKQLQRGPGGCYEMNLIWKDNHPPLKNNRFNSHCRLISLIKYLTHSNQLEGHDNIIQDQIKEGIVGKVDEVCKQEVIEGEKVF